MAFEFVFVAVAALGAFAAGGAAVMLLGLWHGANCSTEVTNKESQKRLFHRTSLNRKCSDGFDCLALELKFAY